MLRKILSYGVLAGLLVGVPLSALVILVKGPPSSPWGMVIGYVMMLIALSTVFIAIKRHRDQELGGVIRFWPAFGLGLGISFIASIIYMLTWEAAVAFTHMDFGTAYANALIEEQRTKGVSGEALTAFIAEMDTFKQQYANPLFRLPMTFAEIFPIGVLVSLISAAVLRYRRSAPARA